MKKILLCLPVLFSLSVCNGNATNEAIRAIGPRKESGARTRLDHPEIAGFTYQTGDRSQVIATEPTGYFFYDADIYYNQFTSVSRLYIIHVRVDYTSGSQAHDIDDDCDWHYDLWGGEASIEVKGKSISNQRTSSFEYGKAWPLSNSDSLTYSASSTFGTEYTISKDIETGVNMTEGAYIAEKTGTSFTIGFSKTTTIYGPEPAVNAQRHPKDQNRYIWDFQYHEIFKGTFTMNYYYMFEVKNDSTMGSGYAFDYDINIKMTCIAWWKYPWQQLKDTSVSLSRTYGY